MNANYAEICRVVGNLEADFQQILLHVHFFFFFILKFSQCCCETSKIKIQQRKVKKIINVFLDKINK